MGNIPEPLEFDPHIYDDIRETLAAARRKTCIAVNEAMVNAYWEIGRQIVEAQGERAEYGKRLLEYLAARLTREFGKGFDATNLRKMRQFYLAFEKRDALRLELSWTHYRLIMRLPNGKAARVLHERSRRRAVELASTRATDFHLILRTIARLSSRRKTLRHR